MPDFYPFTHSSPSPDKDLFYFSTNAGNDYILSFQNIKDVDGWPELLMECPILHSACYIILSLKSAKKSNIIDNQVGATSAEIIKQYVKNQQGQSDGKIYIYDPETSDGMQKGRYRKFNRWFESYSTDANIEKYDIDILEQTEEGEIASFISVMYDKNHPKKLDIINEIVQLKNFIMYGPNDEEDEIL